MKKLLEKWKKIPKKTKIFHESVALIAIILVVWFWIDKSYPADNPLEEFIEDYIEEKTGIPLDFSPSHKD